MAMLGAAALSASARRLAMAGRGVARGSLGFPPAAARSPARAYGGSSSFGEDYYSRRRFTSSSIDDVEFDVFFLLLVPTWSCMLMGGCGRSKAKARRQEEEEDPVAAPRTGEPEKV